MAFELFKKEIEDKTPEQLIEIVEELESELFKYNNPNFRFPSYDNLGVLRTSYDYNRAKKQIAIIKTKLGGKPK